VELVQNQVHLLLLANQFVLVEDQQDHILVELVALQILEPDLVVAVVAMVRAMQAAVAAAVPQDIPAQGALGGAVPLSVIVKDKLGQAAVAVAAQGL
jgi:hypothetical protein